MSKFSSVVRVGRAGSLAKLLFIALVLCGSALTPAANASSIVGPDTVGSNCQLPTPPSPTIVIENGVKKIRGIAYMTCKTDTYVNKFYSTVYDATPQQNILASSIVYQNFTAKAGVTYYAEAKSDCSGRGINGLVQTYVKEDTATDNNYNTSPWSSVNCLS